MAEAIMSAEDARSILANDPNMGYVLLRSGQNVTVPSDRVDRVQINQYKSSHLISVHEYSIPPEDFTNPPPPPDPDPEVLIVNVMPETMLWNTMFRIDDGGPIGTAQAEDYITRMANAGALGICFTSDHADWSVPLIRAAGLKAYYYDYAWYNGYQGVIGIRSVDNTNVEVYHGGDNVALANAIYDWPYSGPPPVGRPDATRRYLYCPNYRGPEYQAAIDRAVYYCNTYDVDAYVTDTEIWTDPEPVNDYYNPRTVGSGRDKNGNPAPAYNAIADCSRCGDYVNYLSGWRGTQTELAAAIQAVRPGIPVYFYNNHIGNRSGYFTAYWRNPAITAMPAFYATFRPTWYTNALGRTFNSSQEYLEAALEIVPVTGGYPWLNPYEYTDDVVTRTATDGEWYDCCKLLADAGAKGYSIFPSPYTLTAEQKTNYYHLVELGLSAF